MCGSTVVVSSMCGDFVGVVVVVGVFFFSSRRRHTRCSRDWSSDVCSSDLWLIVDGLNVVRRWSKETVPHNGLSSDSAHEFAWRVLC